MQLKVSRRDQIKRLTEFSVLLALELIVCFTPLGTIQIGPIAATLSHIPVIVAAIVLGTNAGALMGFVFGLCSFIVWTFLYPNAPTAYMFTPFFQLGDVKGSAWSLVICFVPRILIGVVAGEVCRFVKQKFHKDGLAYGLAGALGSLVTTVLVLGLTYLLIGRNYVAVSFTGAEASLPTDPMAWLLGIIGSTVLLNGIPELVLGTLVAVGLGYALLPRRRTIGIDIGATATKLVLCSGDKVLATSRKEDGERIEDAVRRLGIGNVKRIYVTGVGASFIEGDLLNIPTTRVAEFQALAKGAALVSGKHNLVVASIGTGTSFVRVTPFRSFHIGGTGVGGGMLAGLSRKLFGSFEPQASIAAALQGDLKNCDLVLGDVCNGTISNLNSDTTIANLAKADTAGDEDLALGLYNTVFQSIGVMAAFAAKMHGTRTVVFCGTVLEQQPVAEAVLNGVAALHGLHFILPDEAAYVTAIGATQF